MHWQLNNIYAEDSIKALKTIPDNFVHLILSDIPYGINIEEWDVIHKNTNSALLGTSPAQQKTGGIFKKRGKPINGWSKSDRTIPKQYYEWCSKWAPGWYRILKPGGSAFVFAGRRLSHRCIVAMEDAGFLLKDIIAWLKDKAPHRAQRISVVYERRNEKKLAEKWEGWKIGNLRPVFEPILWFIKPYKLGGTIADNVIEYDVGAYNEQAFLKYNGYPNNVIKLNFTKNEKKLHPTQKPLLLMKALIELTTKEGHIVLDPFCGSGTTLVAAKELKRKFLGFDINPEYVKIAKKRLQEPIQTRLI